MLRYIAIATTVLVLIFIGGALIGDWFLGEDEHRPDIVIDPGSTPDQFDPDHIGSTHDITGMGRGEGGWIQQVDPDTGRLVREFRYQKLDPKESGEFEVSQPEARIYIAPHRVVRLRSDDGYIVAPDNIPLEGTFRQDVKVMIYESPRDRKPDLSDDSPDIAAVIYLDDAKFSTVLGKIDSAGKVRVQTPDAYFLGRGLTLLYNEPEQRIDFLEIAQGQKLVYQPSAESKMRLRASETEGGDEGTAPDPDAKPDENLQYYQIVFESAIHATSNQQTIDADQLVGIFSFSRSNSTLRSLSRRTDVVPHGLAMLPTHTAAPLTALAMAQPQPADMPVTMTWRGKVTITPITEKPLRLRGADDVLLTFTGTPVEVLGENEERITCSRVEYHQAFDQIGAIGSPAHPLVIDSPAMGSVTARELAIRMKQGRGVLWGKGNLRAKDREDDDAKGLPSGFVIGWSDRVELTLTKPDEKPAGLKAARFIGDVDVDDRRFEMNGRILNVRFEPTADKTEYAFAGIDGYGQVKATAEQGTIEAEQISLNTTQVGDRIVPDLLTARDKVKVTDFKQSISTDDLQVTFAQSDKPDAEDWQADVDQVVAKGNVIATLDDGTRVEADELHAHNPKQTATLVGKPLRVVRDDAELRVRQLDILDGGQIATTTGPGQFLSIQRDKDDANKPPRTIDVRWTKQMNYYEKANLLNVVGNVVVEHSDKPTEVDRMMARTMQLKLIDSDSPIAKPKDDQRLLLREMTAEGDVVLMSTRWEEADHKKVMHRLRISGPKLVFDNATERATVIGPGSLLAEDYSPHKQDKNMGAVRVSGKGASLFTWTGSLTMDAAKTDIIFDRGVNMTHRPADSKQLIEMQADRLVADMEGLAGIETLSMSQTSSLWIDHIEATGGVQVRDSDRLISARRLYYEGDKQTALLEAGPDEYVQITKLDEPRPIRAQRIMWDLNRDRLEVLRGGF